MTTTTEKNNHIEMGDVHESTGTIELEGITIHMKTAKFEERDDQCFLIMDYDIIDGDEEKGNSQEFKNKLGEMVVSIIESNLKNKTEGDNV